MRCPGLQKQNISTSNEGAAILSEVLSLKLCLGSVPTLILAAGSTAAILITPGRALLHRSSASTAVEVFIPQKQMELILVETMDVPKAAHDLKPVWHLSGFKIDPHSECPFRFPAAWPKNGLRVSRPRTQTVASCFRCY